MLAQESEQSEPAKILVVSSGSNDLYQLIQKKATRFDSLDQALLDAQDGSSLLILADGYPETTTEIDQVAWSSIHRKGLRVFIEYPSFVPGIEFGPAEGVRWERAITSVEQSQLGLPYLSILSMQDCRYLPIITSSNREPTNPYPSSLMLVGRVAGFDNALFGIPAKSHPVLVRASRNVWICTTKFSNFLSARYAPHDSWETVWETLLDRICPIETPWELRSTPSVRPYYSSTAELPEDAARKGIERGANWFKNSRLLVHATRVPSIQDALLNNIDVLPVPSPESPVGDGSQGILEGYASQILPDGSQLQRTPLRADCQAESAAALAMNAAINGDAKSAEIAKNLLDYLYFTSDMQQKERGDPNHPAYGLIAWGTISPAWYRGNYGDDNARVLLATILSGAMLDSKKWDEPVLRAIHANWRTTGNRGFRGDRVDIPQLEAEGLEMIAARKTVNLSPFFESYLWACYLWAYKQTGDKKFYDTAVLGIEQVMEAYPDRWRWGDNLDRTHILLALAWLVRVDQQPKHEAWLRKVMDDMLANQNACGAIPELLGNLNSGHYQAPVSNEVYGTMETPLIQTNGDPVSDQLYVSGFALLALRETNAAIEEPRYREAETKLAEYILRIQVHSPGLEYLDGTWFRAFDFERWDYWSSSGDMGWGAWCAEAGWGPAWNIIALGLREKNQSIWDLSLRQKFTNP